jgi:hypothetical protein
VIKSQLAAVLAPDRFTPELVATLVICSAVVALWAGFRPDMVRDGEGRRLPPNLTARLTFVVLVVIGFLALSMAFHFGGILVKRLSQFTGFGARFFDQFQGQAPILGLLAVCGFYSLEPFRQVEQHFLAWLHNTRHLRGDLHTLAQHLQDCTLVPSPEERRRNIETLASLDVFVTDPGTTATINLASVITWRKTASLLRHVREWHAVQSRILSDDELRILAELEQAHARKTRLAMDIVRIFEHLREGGDTSKALTNVTEILAHAPHRDRREVSALEERAQASLQGGERAAGDRPVRLSTSDLQQHLKKIEGYFLVEYRLMLEQAADLAAKSILRAGDRAAERLDQLKASGFDGLGAIEPLSAHRIIWFLVSITAGGFLIYYVSWFDEAMRRIQALVPPGRSLSPAELGSIGRTFLIGIATFVAGIALASLVGALVGSGSRHVRARETLWGTYVFAGLAAVAAFFVLQLMREAVTLSLDAALASDLRMPSDPLARLKGIAPWSILPFLVAVGICRLARVGPWVGRLRLDMPQTLAAMIERAVDGLVIGLLMIPGFVLALASIRLFGLPPPAIVKPGFDLDIVRNLFVFGFFVGALVVRNVRSAAHAQLVVRSAPRRAEAPEAIGLATAAAPR